MDPQQRAFGAPIGEDPALEEPQSSSSLINLTRDVIILGRIWGGNPISGVLLQMVTCQIDSVEVIEKERQDTVMTDVSSYLSRSLPLA